MNNTMTSELLARISSANGKEDERVTVSLHRCVVAVLEKYRKRELGEKNRMRRASLGETATELILCADEMLTQRAGEKDNGIDADAVHRNAK